MRKMLKKPVNVQFEFNGLLIMLKLEDAEKLLEELKKAIVAGKNF